MSAAGHLAELERRHKLLEKEIEEHETHPSEDPLKIADLKRKKLKVKDEILKFQDASAQQQNA